MYFFRALSILCLVSALIAMFFWVGDKISGMEFRQGWLLFSSLLWMIVFWGLHVRDKRKHPLNDACEKRSSPDLSQ
jgi:hypothetical protein